MSPVRYELGFYIPEDDILHGHRREYLKLYIGDLMRSEEIIEMDHINCFPCRREPTHN
jgi:hypothetical protein